MNSKDLYIFIWLYSKLFESNPNCAPKLVATSQNFLTYIKSIYRGWFDIGIQDTVKSLKLSNKFRKEVVIPECIKTLFYTVILERRVEKRRFIICTSVPFNTLFGFSSFHYIVQEIYISRIFCESYDMYSYEYEKLKNVIKYQSRINWYARNQNHPHSYIMAGWLFPFYRSIKWLLHEDVQHIVIVSQKKIVIMARISWATSETLSYTLALSIRNELKMRIYKHFCYGNFIESLVIIILLTKNRSNKQLGSELIKG